MPKERKNIDKKAALSALIPAIIAVVVVVALAVSGHITKKKDLTAPTNTTNEIVTESTTDNTNTKVSLVAVGDNLIHNTLITAGEQEDGSLNYDSFYQNMKPYISGADIAVINQETVLGGSDFQYTGYPVFNSPQEIGEACINAGFDVFTLATNHAMDVGAAGIEKECEFFSKHKNITHMGRYSDENEAAQISYMQKNGLTFAMLNYTYGTNGISMPDDKSYLVSMLNKDKIKSDVEKARKNADVIIVFPHWGTENSHEINDIQRDYVKLFSDLGVDIVIGCHPHVLQPVEWVKSEETGKQMIVYYSLGNFISHQINLNQMCGGMAEITVERKNGEVSVTSAKLAPVIDYYTKTDSGFKFSVYKYSDYTEELAQSQAQKGATKEYFSELSQEIIGEEFLDLK